MDGTAREERDRNANIRAWISDFDLGHSREWTGELIVVEGVLVTGMSRISMAEWRFCRPFSMTRSGKSRAPQRQLHLPE